MMIQTSSATSSTSAAHAPLPQGARAAVLVAGVFMTLLGAFAISWACLTTITTLTVWIFGLLLIVGGASEVLGGLFVGRAGAGFGARVVHVLVGVLYVVAGVVFVNEPQESAVRLTLVIALFLMISGAVRLALALSERFAGWGTVAFSGVVTLALGIMIYRQWPVSGLWTIGLFVGIEMLTNGWTWIALALGAGRSGPAHAEARAA
jgi:uncharacterized membrane protein HdeD (DUF308 family)